MKIRLFDNGREGPRLNWNPALFALIRETIEKRKGEGKVVFVWRLWLEAGKTDAARREPSFDIFRRVYSRYKVQALEVPEYKDAILRIYK